MDAKVAVPTAILLLPVLIVGPVLFIAAVDRDQLRAALCDPAGAGSAVDPGSVPQGPIGGYGHEQLVNAAYVMSAAAALGLSVRDQQIGVMTAMGESGLRILDYGDAAGPDSRGLFQQRDNGAWGSYGDRMDPFVSATNFFKVEMTVAGRESMEPTLVANAVQRNADPHYYTQFWDAAGQVVQVLRGNTGTTSGETTTVATQYSLGDVQPQTAVVANTVGLKFGIKTIGGWRDPATELYDPNGHPAGLALDFMISDLENGITIGDQVAAYLSENAGTLGVSYIIWKQAIWSPDRADEGWRAMEDRGTPTQNHLDHVHLSLTGQGSSVANPCVPGGGGGLVSGDGWVAPTTGPITSWFHENRAAYGMHYGLDIAPSCGTEIHAAGAGTVEAAGPAQGYGNWIVIDHGGGIRTIYGHMYSNDVLTSVGANVTAGQLIGRVGSAGESSGCHLHFQVEINGTPTNPITFLADRGVQLPSGAHQ